MSCPGRQQRSPSLLAVTNPCFVLTLDPLLPTSPGRPRGPSGPGSPCEEGKDVPGQGCLQCCLCAWQCSLERGGMIPFSNLVFLGLKHTVRAACSLNMSLSLELCCPSSPLWIKPWKRRLYLLPLGQAVGTVEAEHTCRAHWDLQFPALVLDTSWLGSSTSHTLVLCILGSFAMVWAVALLTLSPLAPGVPLLPFVPGSPRRPLADTESDINGM